MLVYSRSDFGDYTKPDIWGTSAKVQSFVTEVLNVPPTKLAGQFEAYQLAGIQSE